MGWRGTLTRTSTWTGNCRSLTRKDHTVAWLLPVVSRAHDRNHPLRNQRLNFRLQLGPSARQAAELPRKVLSAEDACPITVLPCSVHQKPTACVASPPLFPIGQALYSQFFALPQLWELRRAIRFLNLDWKAGCFFVPDMCEDKSELAAALHKHFRLPEGGVCPVQARLWVALRQERGASPLRWPGGSGEVSCVC